MYNDRFKITLQAKNGNYYSAVQNTDNTWTVTNAIGVSYIQHLPKGWDETDITWERNMSYYGIFRSQTQKFNFSKDGRAILLSILADKGTNGYCKMSILVYNESTLEYDVFYKSIIDFSGASDSKKQQLLTVSTLDGELTELVKAKSQSEFNIPFWEYSDIVEDWILRNGVACIKHDGIKLLWKAQYVSAATATNLLAPPTSGGLLVGWNRGSTTDGRHWIPAMNKYNVAQANGTTTFIGNDILEVVLVENSQPPNYNLNFNGSDDIQAYSKNQCIIKNQLVTTTGAVDMKLRVYGNFEGSFTYNNFILQDQYLRIVLFEIDEQDEPITISGNYQYQTLFSLTLPQSSSPYTAPSMDFDTTTDVSITYNKAFVIGVIYDGVTSGISSSNGVEGWQFSKLEAQLYSDSNSGTSTPVDAPIYPSSTFVAFRPHGLFQHIVDCLDSVTTDAYGFPVQLGSGYIAESDFLSDPDLDPSTNYDLVPYRCLETCENAVREIIGYPYMTKSLASFFQQWNKINMLGLGIIGENTIKIEPLTYFFDASTEILDLGVNVADFTITPYTEPLGNILNAGYTALQTNKNFGVDSFCMPMKWELPLNKTPKTLDYQVTEANTDIYYIEKARVQNNSNNSSASSSNDSILIQVEDSFVFSNVRNPINELVVVDAYPLETYPTAQSTNPTASPYIKGMYYPDTAYNMGLDPSSNIRRNGRYIRALCDGQDDFGSVMSFRKIYQQQYNDPTTPALELAGMEKLLNHVTVVTQVKDIPLTEYAKLFRPFIFEVQSEYPVNMYETINTNPYGYVRFLWKGEDFDYTEYKGFLLEVKQSAANNKATMFKLLAHPSTSDAALKKA